MKKSIRYFFCLLFLFFPCLILAQNNISNVMMQAFYWDVPVDEANKNGSWWDHLREIAPELKDVGITSVWTPVPAKGNWGIVDSGYGIYDHFDLGNYFQKGTIETRYGSRKELEEMIAEMHRNNIKVYSDVVLNHLYGGDENFEKNPVVTDYVKSGRKEAYPEEDIRWIDSVAYTKTHLYFPKHNGAGEPNYEWRYWNFHPSSENDSLTDFTDDVLRPRTKFFGNDLDTYSVEVQTRLCNWGKWLRNEIGFDGFRMDFVRGLQPEFVSRWIRGLPLLNGKQPFVVGEYWGSAKYIKEWVDSVAKGNANVHAFDFPLKFTLTEMCNNSGNDFDISRLNHAGMIRNNEGYALPPDNVVTFVDNHDTGKEHDKWITKDYAMAYAYILTHEGTPCIFYPHYFTVKQYDVNDHQQIVESPTSLKDTISKLIEIRKKYIGGKTVVLTETGNPSPEKVTKNVYVARRQGTRSTSGAIIVLNNNDTDTLSINLSVNSQGFKDLSDTQLVDAFSPTNKVKVSKDGRVTFIVQPRGFSIWVKENEL